MKVSNKFKIWGFVGLIVGILLVISSFTIFKQCVNCGKGWESHRETFGESYQPNLLLLFFGAVVAIISIALLANGFRPNIAKAGAQLHSETMDYAGEDITDALDKTIDVAGPVLKKTVKTIKSGFVDDTKTKLDEAKALYENGDISNEEYEALRKKILDI